MEALSLLKYWRASHAANVRAGSPCTTTITATTATLKQPPAADNDNDNDNDNDDDDDEGPFFDLEFALPDDGDDADEGDEVQGEEEEEDPVDGSEETDGEREFDLAVSSEGRSDSNLTLSPSDDLFFKGKLVPLQPSTFNPSSEPNSKTPQFPASFLKTATKFRIFLLGFKKPKPCTSETMTTTASPKQQNKLFTVKLKVDDAPIVSLFTRDGSSRSSTNKIQRSQRRRQQQQQQDDMVSEDGVSSSDAKRFTKDVVHKYLRRIKPLYVKVSRKYGEKLRFSGHLSLGPVQAPAAAEGGLMSGVTAAGNSDGTPTGENVGDGEAEPVPAKPEESPAPPLSASAAAPNRNHLPTGLRVVCKHLGKSRSASAAVAAVTPATLQGQGQGQRRDDSLFQQQDGIQSAIAHCKKSFHASKEKEGLSLPRCVSETSAEKSGDSRLRCSGKGKEACI